MTKDQEIIFAKAVDLVSDFTNIPVDEILTKKKFRKISYARHLAMRLIYEYYSNDNSIVLDDIGKYFGGCFADAYYANTKKELDQQVKQLIKKL